MPILPKPRTAFIMAPSVKNQTVKSKVVIQNVQDVLSSLRFKVIEGSKIVKHGDYFCSICQETQGCALGIAMVYDGLPVSTIANIYFETGIMQGFGKPVILFVDKKKNLPSDYVRHYAIFYNSRNYLSRYKSLLEGINKLPDEIYEYMGELAFKAEDYEKAAKYYEEAFLLSPKRETLKELESIGCALENANHIPKSYKKRLLDNIKYFCLKAECL